MYCKVDNSPYGYILLTTEGYIKDVNQTFCKMLEYDYKDLLNQHIESLLSVASKMMFHSLFFLKLQYNGRVDEVYLSLKTKSGIDIPILLIGNREIYNNNEFIDCVAVKMTKRNDYEKELQNIKMELEEAYKIKNAALNEESKLRELFQTTLFSINEGIIVTDNQGRITIMNKLAEKYTGWPKEYANGENFDKIFNNINSKTRERSIEPVKHVIKTGESITLSDNELLVSKDGNEIYIYGSANRIFSEDGEVRGVVISFMDVTKQYQQEKEIEWFLNVNLDMLCVLDTDGIFIKVNKKFEEVLGYNIYDLEGKKYISLVIEEDIRETLEILKKLAEQNSISNFTNRCKRKDGSYRYIEWCSELNGKYVYLSARDVTEKYMQQEKLKNIAVTDELTGLYNRHFLDIKIKEELEKADSNNVPISMILFDIDHFKNINDKYGHPVGDEVLKELANISRGTIRKSDILVRFGGEEFIVLMPYTDDNDAMIVAEKIRESLEKNINHIVGKYTASFGVAKRIKTESFISWYKRVDDALYQAKKEGRNRVINANSSNIY